MERKEKCIPEVPVVHWVCIYCPGVPSHLGKEGEVGRCRTGLLCVWAFNVSWLGQNTRVSSLSAAELLGKLTTEEWAPWEQNTINSTIWVLLPITTPFRKRNDFLVVGQFKFIALLLAIELRGKSTTWIPYRCWKVICLIKFCPFIALFLYRISLMVT